MRILVGLFLNIIFNKYLISALQAPQLPVMSWFG